ncbi:hypothetical protein BDM02DRAFT_3185340 [Thelephora ganbajun]|uniref:Uncharacterized protein n=1 Tax=Thelephora ganbajun TaxID=370292 RepID=A0ACB6ZME4_THEGA|nr:hypothetical protein BDM02DRAFT_3185340 [Thelephora ganbajun]
MKEDKHALLSSSVEASPEELAASILPDDQEIHHPSGGLQIELGLASSLSVADKDDIWKIFANAMQEMYETSSFCWNPTKKKREMFHKLGRFILVRSKKSTKIVAFTSFRFEEEEEYGVVYCYELHVSPAFHRCGLGRKLTQMLFDICKRRGLDKVMLTVFKGTICRNYPAPRHLSFYGSFKANETAILFYQSIGFTLDPSSPGYGASLPVDDGDDDWEDEGRGYVDEECDYMILSRSVALATH